MVPSPPRETSKDAPGRDWDKGRFPHRPGAYLLVGTEYRADEHGFPGLYQQFSGRSVAFSSDPYGIRTKHDMISHPPAPSMPHATRARRHIDPALRREVPVLAEVPRYSMFPPARVIGE
jgi:hypothetical protein